jgi:hypothetical protein
MTEDFWSEWCDLGEWCEMAPTVCLTHKRFIPCRKDDGTCQITTNQEDVDHVRRYQKGEVDS